MLEALLGATDLPVGQFAVPCRLPHRRQPAPAPAACSPNSASIAELKSAGLAHLPSGNFMANAAWLALAVMTHNLGTLGRIHTIPLRC